MGVPAQAYNTTYCHPCSIPDVIDGTYFQYDPGGEAVKLDIQNPSKTRYLGKLEFHPNGEQVWLYDNAKDGDSVYFQIAWKVPGQKDVHWTGIHRGTAREHPPHAHR